MAVLNADPYYYLDADKPNYSSARATALEVMAEARKHNEYVRVGFENRYYVDGLEHCRITGEVIGRNRMMKELEEYLLNGITLRVDNLEWSI